MLTFLRCLVKLSGSPGLEIPFLKVLILNYEFNIFNNFESESHSVLSNPLWPHSLYSPWTFPGQNTGVGSLFLLQGIFPTQELNLGLPHCRWVLYQLSNKGSSRILGWVACPFSSRFSCPRNWTGVSCIAGGFFTNWAIREALRAIQMIYLVFDESGVVCALQGLTHFIRGANWCVKSCPSVLFFSFWWRRICSDIPAFSPHFPFFPLLVMPEVCQFYWPFQGTSSFFPWLFSIF